MLPSTPLSTIPSIKKFHLDRLRKLGIVTAEDLLRHFPARYEDFSLHVPIAEITPNARVTIEGTVRNFSSKKSWRKKLLISEATVVDETGSIRALWFGQKFLESVLILGKTVRLSGKAVLKNNELFLQSPECEPASKAAVHTASLVPVYPETEGLTSKWLRWQIRTFLSRVRFEEDPVPETIREKLHLPSQRHAFVAIHTPKKKEHYQLAQKYFAFEEMFLLQLFLLRSRQEQTRTRARHIPFSHNEIDAFLTALPFPLTEDQHKAITHILEDLDRPHPMNRLLNGDVGSGKTVVAAIAARHVARAQFQTALLAPTEVLALQHFHSFSSLLENEPVSIGLFTNAYQYLHYPKQTAIETLDRKKMKKALASGLVDIVIGTHAIIQKDIAFKNLALVVVDEQHRFGVSQRAYLTQISTQTDAEQKQTDADSPNFPLSDLTYLIRGILFEVKKELGPGHKEIIYHKAILEECKKRNIHYTTEKSLPVFYKGTPVGTYRPDIIIEDTVIVELKAQRVITLEQKKQVWQYLSGSQYQVALLVNFGGKDIEIERFVHTKKNKRAPSSSPHVSAYSESPYKSAYPENPYDSVSSYAPHLLTMTATPIPRTLSLAFFGNLDVSLLETMPKNRLPVITRIVEACHREQAYTFIRSQIASGRQAYIILPFVEESDAFENVKAAVTEHARLQKEIFPDLSLGLLHGRLKAKEKESVMSDFKEQKISVLVATSVVEVGVDVPNATVMIIENADRFGLSQLHQFRGRIGRGAHQSYCFLFASTLTPNHTDLPSPTQTHVDKDKEYAKNPSRRMRILEKTTNGFKIAEEDLKLRGPGQFLGSRQSGLPDIAMESMGNLRLIAIAKEEAETLLTNDPDLHENPTLQKKLARFGEEFHPE